LHLAVISYLCIVYVHYIGTIWCALLATNPFDMPIPKDILSVPRPPSTRVKKSGGRYLVIKRTCRRVDGRNVPVELGTIGEIVDGAYREIRPVPRPKGVDVKDYDLLRLCDSAGGELLGQMGDSIGEEQSKRLYVMALIRSCYGDVASEDMQWRYDTSFASEIYPGMDLSSESTSSLMKSIGERKDTIGLFMKRRMEANGESPLVVDALTRKDYPPRDAFREFRSDDALRGQGSFLYAFNPITREPVVAKPYSGDIPLGEHFRDFVGSYGISSGMMISDKDFSFPQGRELPLQVDGLSCLVPMKISSALVARYGMDNPSERLDGYKGGTVLYKKTRTPGGVYLYSFRDAWPTHEQIVGCLCNDIGKSLYGLVILRTEKDYPPLQVYQAYIQRKDIEMLLSREMDIPSPDEDQMAASHLVTFLSCVISMRLKRIFIESDLNRDYSFRQIVDLLSTHRMARSTPGGPWTGTTSPEKAQAIRSSLGMDSPLWGRPGKEGSAHKEEGSPGAS